MFSWNRSDARSPRLGQSESPGRRHENQRQPDDLKPPMGFGSECLTYLLWAITGEAPQSPTCSPEPCIKQRARQLFRLVDVDIDFAGLLSHANAVQHLRLFRFILRNRQASQAGQRPERIVQTLGVLFS